MKLWLVFIFTLCCLSGCDFENPFLDPLLYTITFDADGGTPATATAICAPGDAVTPPSAPTRANYAFDGWYTEQGGGGTRFTAATKISADMTLYARWIPYPKVTFDADGGAPTTTAICAPGGTAALPSPPARTGYVFFGWYTAKGGNGVEFTAATKVGADITVYARWIGEADAATVTFNADGGAPVPAPALRVKGETLGALPANPTRAGYAFDGWFTAQGGNGTRLTAASPVTADITAYAKWIPYLQVTFDTDDGEPTTTAICAPGDAVTPPSAPTRADYAFDGWYTAQSGGGERFTAASPVTTDITVYAKWIPYPKVTFDADGGAPTTTAICAPGNTAALPSPPARTGYVFWGWYTAPRGGGAEFTAATKVSADITVYARWIDKADTVTVTFDAGGGTPVPAPVLRVKGEALGALPANPAKVGYTFSGWHTAPHGGGERFTAATKVGADMIVYAWWRPPSLTAYGMLEPSAGAVWFPNIYSMSLPKGTALTITLSGTNVDWPSARWAIKVDAASVSITGGGASRIWSVPMDTKNGQYTITVMVWIASTLYVGNFPILITN